MGLVYLADQEADPQQVVVKVLAPHWINDDAARGRFDREARALATLRHPNIVTMYDFGRDAERAYLVMEYLRGVPLSQHLARTPQLSLAEFVPIAAQILKGTGYAHTREIVVRDIKPANVMLCERRGRANFVKLLDFGLAKLVHNDTPITEDQALGTIGYIAPESVLGQPPDLRVDVYALGVLFYQMLCGRLPFEPSSGGSAAMLYKTVNEQPTPLEDLLPAGHDVPTGLIECLHRCLSKDPEERPSDANAMVEQMIDVVPASLFRLPRAGPRGASEASNSGPVLNSEITGLSGLLRPPPRVPESGGAVIRSSNSPEASGASPVSTQVTNVESPARRGNLGLIVGLVVGGAGITAALVTQCGQSQPEPATVAAAGPEPGSNDSTETKPRAPANAAPKATPAEASPEPSPQAAPEPVAALGLLSISSSPTSASVLIDGEVVGVTPYDGKTTLGTHTLAVEAPGYHRWSSQIDIATEPNEPLSVTLVPLPGSKRPRGGRGRSHRTSSKAPAHAPTAVPSEPSGKPDTQTPRGDKPSDAGFLPSSDKPRKSDLLLGDKDD